MNEPEVKELEWHDGEFGYVYGYVDQVRLFSLGYRDGGYMLGTELPGIKPKRAPDLQSGKLLAQKILGIYVKFLTKRPT